MTSNHEETKIRSKVQYNILYVPLSRQNLSSATAFGCMVYRQLSSGKG